MTGGDTSHYTKSDLPLLSCYQKYLYRANIFLLLNIDVNNMLVVYDVLNDRRYDEKKNVYFCEMNVRKV